MITITPYPQANNDSRMLITGDNMEELVTECLSRIRTGSKNFYKRELESDLKDFGRSIIDSHAGMRITYIVKLNLFK